MHFQSHILPPLPVCNLDAGMKTAAKNNQVQGQRADDVCIFSIIVVLKKINSNR